MHCFALHYTLHLAASRRCDAAASPAPVEASACCSYVGTSPLLEGSEAALEVRPASHFIVCLFVLKPSARPLRCLFLLLLRRLLYLRLLSLSSRVACA